MVLDCIFLFLNFITNMISKKIIVKTVTIISKQCMYNRGIHDMLNFVMISFF